MTTALTVACSDCFFFFFAIVGSFRGWLWGGGSVCHVIRKMGYERVGQRTVRLLVEQRKHRRCVHLQEYCLARVAICLEISGAKIKAKQIRRPQQAVSQ